MRNDELKRVLNSAFRISHSSFLLSVPVRVVPDVAVAARARELAAHPAVPALDGLHDRFVAGAARALRNFVVELVDADRLVEAAGREVERVPEAVARLGVVLAQQVVRRVAVVAAGDRAVRGLDPAVELLAHDVTVGARLRVVGQVRVAARVDEGEAADADDDAEGDADHHAPQSLPAHKRTRADLRPAWCPAAPTPPALERVLSPDYSTAATRAAVIILRQKVSGLL